MQGRDKALETAAKCRVLRQGRLDKGGLNATMRPVSWICPDQITGRDCPLGARYRARSTLGEEFV